MRFPIAGILMVAISGICLFLYVIFRYVIINFRNVLWGYGNTSLSGDELVQFSNNMTQLSDGFGLAGVVIFSLAIVFFLVDIFSHPRGDMY